MISGLLLCVSAGFTIVSVVVTQATTRKYRQACAAYDEATEVLRRARQEAAFGRRRSW